MSRYARLQQLVDDLAATRSPARVQAMNLVFWAVQARSPFGGEARRRRCEALAAAGAPMPTTWPPAELADLEVPEQ